MEESFKGYYNNEDYSEYTEFHVTLFKSLYFSSLKKKKVKAIKCMQFRGIFPKGFPSWLLVLSQHSETHSIPQLPLHRSAV